MGLPPRGRELPDHLATAGAHADAALGLGHFDLWSYDDVRTHADAILARIRGGTMPCDGARPADKVDTFRRWVASGTPS